MISLVNFSYKRMTWHIHTSSTQRHLSLIKQKLLLICKELPAVAFSYHVKIRELLTSGGAFAVNRYKYFMVNKNIRTFCCCKLSKKKNNIKPHQNFTCYKKHGGSWLTSRDRISKVKKDRRIVTKNYRNNFALNLKTSLFERKRSIL